MLNLRWVRIVVRPTAHFTGDTEQSLNNRTLLISQSYAKIFSVAAEC
jgi:hypothetical protein